MLLMEFDPLTLCWQLVEGEEEEEEQTENQRDIIGALHALGRAKVHTIAKYVEKDRSNTRKRLERLWTQGLCQRDLVEGEFYYYLKSLETTETIEEIKEATMLAGTLNQPSLLRTSTEPTQVTQPTQPTHRTQATQGG